MDEGKAEGFASYMRNTVGVMPLDAMVLRSRLKRLQSVPDIRLRRENAHRGAAWLEPQYWQCVTSRKLIGLFY